MSLKSNIIAGDVEKVRHDLAQRGTAELYADHDGMTLIGDVIVSAFYEDDDGPLRTLLEAGLPPDFIAYPDQGQTLLMAASRSNPRVVRLLIDAGASINSRDHRGWTPLMQVSAYDSSAVDVRSSIDIIKELRAAGADVAMRNDAGWTAAEILEGQSALEVKDKEELMRSLMEPI